jgi:hypothetical protein
MRDLLVASSHSSVQGIARHKPFVLASSDPTDRLTIYTLHRLSSRLVAASKWLQGKEKLFLSLLI